MFNTKLEQFFQLYHGENKIQTKCTLNEMMMMELVHFVLDQQSTCKLDFNSVNSLKQQSVDRHAAPLGHYILIPRQPRLCSDSLVLCAKQQIPIL